MKRSTERCGRHGHPEFVLTCADDIAFDLPWLLNLLEERVASGTVFRPGDPFQVGSTPLRVGQAEGGRLSLWEPDFSGVADRLDGSVTRSLLALRRQKAVLESLGIGEGEFPSLDQVAVMCGRFGPGRRRYLARESPLDEDSGWFFGCREEDHDHQRPEHLKGGDLYGIVCVHPELLEFLAIPPRYTVVLDERGRVEEARDPEDRPLPIQPGSYLDVRNRSLSND